ncbi:hypothetical protein LZ31DRAFT_44979 [Colletotrichum somersetense]|nr:hypothetical protein LZ31DRAFT_44979 [Colletotrichum somersetense]
MVSTAPTMLSIRFIVGLPLLSCLSTMLRPVSVQERFLPYPLSTLSLVSLLALSRPHRSSHPSPDSLFHDYQCHRQYISIDPIKKSYHALPPHLNTYMPTLEARLAAASRSRM